MVTALRGTFSSVDGILKKQESLCVAARICRVKIVEFQVVEGQ